MRTIRHEKIIFPAETPVEASRPLVAGGGVHRYRGSRPWSVAALATGAALGAVLLTGAVSTSLPSTSYATAPSPKAVLASIRTIEPERESSAAARAIGMIDTGPAWQIQVGSFSRSEAAEARLRSIAGQLPKARDWTSIVAPFGSLSRARIGGFADEAAARGACAAMDERGIECFVVPPRG